MGNSKRLIVSVTTDLVTDQRVHKTCSSLHKAGYEVLLIGRSYSGSLPLEKRNYKCRRMRLWFNNGFLFYANYNAFLLFSLLFNKYDILLANDLDTLPANFLAKKLKGGQLVYDSHEYFTEVPELVNRLRIKKFWERLEKSILPHLKHCYTVTDAIANRYNSKYGINFKVVRNFPCQYNLLDNNDTERNIVIYQGALNVGRGLEELIGAMQFVNEGMLWIAGEGDIKEKLIEKVEKESLQRKVRFLGRIDPQELKQLTAKAKVGVSIEKKDGLNYTYALPNKVFDYLHARVPILYSDLEEVKRTIKGYDLGEELISYEPGALGEQLNRMLDSPKYQHWQGECERASKELNWEKEEQVLLSIFAAL